MSKIKLKPCPFCGGEAIAFKCKVWSTEDNRDVEKWFARCINLLSECDIVPETCEHDTEDEAAEAWNRRAGDE